LGNGQGLGPWIAEQIFEAIAHNRCGTRVGVNSWPFELRTRSSLLSDEAFVAFAIFDDENVKMGAPSEDELALLALVRSPTRARERPQETSETLPPADG